MSINKVVLSGNLTRDPELRATSAGTSVLAVPLAVNDRYRDPKTGEWGDRANYVDCEVWGKRADALARILAKGSKVCVEGRLRWHSWESNDGSKRSKLTVTVDEVELMSQKGAAQQPQGSSPAEVVKAAYPDAELYDEEVPF